MAKPRKTISLDSPNSYSTVSPSGTVSSSAATSFLVAQGQYEQRSGFLVGVESVNGVLSAQWYCAYGFVDTLWVSRDLNTWVKASEAANDGNSYTYKGDGGQVAVPISTWFPALYNPCFFKCTREINTGDGFTQEIINRCFPVKAQAYGARGDGVTDDTAAIRRAIAAAESYASINGSATVFWPDGTYAVGLLSDDTEWVDGDNDKPAVFRLSQSNVSYTGSGIDNTIIKFYTNFTGVSGLVDPDSYWTVQQNKNYFKTKRGGLFGFPSATALTGISFSDMTIDGQVPPSGSRAVGGTFFNCCVYGNTIFAVQDAFSNNTTVNFGGITQALPPELDSSTTYYIVNRDADRPWEFDLSLTSGGEPISVTADLTTHIRMRQSNITSNQRYISYNPVDGHWISTDDLEWMYEDGTRIQFGQNNLDPDLGLDIQIPAQVSINTIYYIVNRSGNSFQAAATEGGSAIAVTDPGGGFFRTFDGGGWDMSHSAFQLGARASDQISIDRVKSINWRGEHVYGGGNLIGKVTISDCQFDGSDSSTVSHPYAEVSNCQFTRVRNGGECQSEASGQSTSFTNCTFTGTVGANYTDENGVVYIGGSSNSLVVSGCSFTGFERGVILTDHASNCTITGNTFTNMSGVNVVKIDAKVVKTLTISGITSVGYTGANATYSLGSSINGNRTFYSADNNWVIAKTSGNSWYALYDASDLTATGRLFWLGPTGDMYTGAVVINDAATIDAVYQNSTTDTTTKSNDLNNILISGNAFTKTTSGSGDGGYGIYLQLGEQQSTNLKIHDNEMSRTGTDKWQYFLSDRSAWAIPEWKSGFEVYENAINAQLSTDLGITQMRAYWHDNTYGADWAAQRFGYATWADNPLPREFKIDSEHVRLDNYSSFDPISVTLDGPDNDEIGGSSQNTSAYTVGITIDGVATAFPVARYLDGAIVTITAVDQDLTISSDSRWNTWASDQTVSVGSPLSITFNGTKFELLS